MRDPATGEACGFAWEPCDFVCHRGRRRGNYDKLQSVTSSWSAKRLREAALGRVFLVVDDEPAVREVAALMLEDLGCEVVTAANGSEALERLALDARIEALITDINMPGMDGYDLAERAQQLRKELKVIVLSGREGDGRGHPLVRKPFLQKDLVRAMKGTTGLC